MKKVTWFDILVGLFIALVAMAIADIAAIYGVYSFYAYIVSFIVVPISVIVLTLYLLLLGKIPKGRVGPYAVFVCGMLIMGFTLALEVEVGGIALIALLIGFVLLCIGLRRTWS